MAMAAIGLNTSIQGFIKAGPRALILGAATWFSVMVTSLAVQLITRNLVNKNLAFVLYEADVASTAKYGNNG